jgi:Uma2 family endonuclease
LAVQFHPQTVPTDEELQFLNARNAPLRFERSLAGELIVSPPTGGATGFQNTELVRQIGNWNLKHGHGKVLESSTGVSIGLNGAPDAGWLSGKRWRAIPKTERTKFIPTPPEVVFELMSPSDTAQGVAARAEEWRTAGVPLAIVLDPNRRVAIPHVGDGEGEPVSKVLRIEKERLPGADEDLVLDLDAIFDAADE